MLVCNDCKIKTLALMKKKLDFVSFVIELSDNLNPITMDSVAYFGRTLFGLTNNVVEKKVMEMVKNGLLFEPKAGFVKKL